METPFPPTDVEVHFELCALGNYHQTNLLGDLRGFDHHLVFKLDSETKMTKSELRALGQSVCGKAL